MSKYKIPPKDEIEKWIKSEEGRLVYETLLAIDLFRHGIDFGPRSLSELYFKNEDVSQKTYEEWVEELKQRMPIKEIYHAAYIPELDRLIISTEDFLLPRKELDEKIKPYVVQGCHYIVGTIATVKSNGWKIFDLLYAGYRRGHPDLEVSIECLARIGYILFLRHAVRSLWKTESEEGYIPVLPKDWT